MIPDHLTHYYEADCGPFLSLTVLPADEAEMILERIRQEAKRFASQRPKEYLSIRRDLEATIRSAFVQKGGRPRRTHPHYFILGDCPWLESWYTQGRAVQVPLVNVSPDSVSFTYGDSFPAMRYQDGRPYRGQVYTIAELPDLVARFGLPQEWNAAGQFGPERYIEAQVWEDEPISTWLNGSGLP